LIPQPVRHTIVSKVIKNRFTDIFIQVGLARFDSRRKTLNKRTIKIFPVILGIILAAVAVWFVVERERNLPPGIASYAEMEAATKRFVSSFSNFESLEGPERVAATSVIYNEKGKQIPLTDTKGKVVVINFWATWCAPCITELPALARLKEARPDIEVIAVSLDLQKTPADLRAFLDKSGAASLDVYFDQGTELNVQFPNRGLPTTYVLSPENKIIYKLEGDADWSSPDALIFIDFVKTQR
jgi:thiol-disulfide isomerase/thioredoxin